MKTITLLLAILLTISQASAFTDIETNWYKHSIEEFKKEELISSDNKTFKPHDNITRAEMLKIILGASEVEVTTPEKSCFPDVSVKSWQAKYVCSWSDKWIAKWYENGKFQPNGKVSVLETLAFGARAFDLEITEDKEEEKKTSVEEKENETSDKDEKKSDVKEEDKIWNNEVEEREESDSEKKNEEKIWEKDEKEEVTKRAWFEKYRDFAHENNIIPIHSYTTNTIITRGQAVELIYRMKEYNDWKKLDYKSVGCSVEPKLKSGNYSVKIWDTERKYLLYVPDWMKKNKEMKLAVAFHGRTNNNNQVRDYMQLGWGAYGYKQNDFIVVYPAAGEKPPFNWVPFNNIELFDAIITKVSTELCVNRDSVFSVGHSLGSYMSNKVSCQRGDVLRAMTWVASDGFKWNCTGPVASLIMHLPKDHLAWYAWGKRAYSIRSSVNICWDEERDTTRWDIKSCKQRTSCTAWNTVLFCNSYDTYWDDQHSWPKSGSDDILDFFRNINE